MSGIEIERKFLVVDEEFKQLAYGKKRIKQGYICSDGKKSIRVRRSDDTAYLTIKGPSNANGVSRYEFEKEITLEEAEELFRLCEPGIIDKTRWLVKSGPHIIEVDEFYGDNEGLVMAEIELSSVDEAYEKPHFIGREVTGDRRFYNANLRIYPFAIWGKTLEK